MLQACQMAGTWDTCSCSDKAGHSQIVGMHRINGLACNSIGGNTAYWGTFAALAEATFEFVHSLKRRLGHTCHELGRQTRM